MSLIRHYRIAGAVWLLVMIIGAPLAWQKGQPHYLSESVFQVSPTYMKNIDADSEVQLGSNSQYREYVSHLASSVIRYDIIEKALQILANEHVDIKPANLTQREHIEKLQATLFVRTIPDTYMVRIGIESEQKKDIDKLINAITDSFLVTTKKEQIFGSGERLRFVEDVQTKLLSEIAAAETARVNLAEKLGVTTFSENTQNPYDAVLTQARDRLTKNSIELAEARAANRTFNEKKELPADARLSLRDLRQQDLGMQTMRN
jgi:capsular polysaccharide biosynthesis protein